MEAERLDVPAAVAQRGAHHAGGAQIVPERLRFAVARDAQAERIARDDRRGRRRLEPSGIAVHARSARSSVGKRLREELRRALPALALLRPRDRAVVVACDIDGEPMKALVDRLGAPLSTVYK